MAKQLHRTLTLSIYRGMIPHKGQIFEGEHTAIIDEAFWNEVQQKLRENQPGNGKGCGHINELAIQQTQLLHPLRGFVYTIDGHALTPTYTNKSSKGSENGKVRKRYRYYVSQQAIRQGYQSTALKTLNADLLENAVRQILAPALPKLAGVIGSENFTSDQVRHRLEGHASQIMGLDSPMELARMIQFLEPKIVVASDKIQIHLMHDRVGKLAAEHMDAPRHPISQDRMLNPEITFGDEEVVVSSSLSLTLQRGRSQVVDRENGVMLSVRESAPNSALIQTIVQAEYWRAQLQNQPDKSLVEILAPHGIQPNYVRRLLNAAYLAPEIKRAIFQGTQPVGMQVQDLIKLRSRDWTVQKRELGFA